MENTRNMKGKPNENKRETKGGQKESNRTTSGNTTRNESKGKQPEI